MSAAIEVPIPLLLDSNLSPSAKLLWTVFRYSNQKAGRLSHRPKISSNSPGSPEAPSTGSSNGWPKPAGAPERRAETSAQTRWQAIWPKEDCETIEAARVRHGSSQDAAPPCPPLLLPSKSERPEPNRIVQMGAIEETEQVAP